MLTEINELFQKADWKTEKHVPVIEVIGETKKSKPIAINVMVGKEISHPNTTEHHIRWIDVYFLPEGEKFPYQIGKSEFTAHGASVNGANSSTIFSDPITNFTFKTEKSGTIMAFSFCNIHGLWQNSFKIKF